MILKENKEEIKDYLSDESNIFTAPAESVKAVYFPECENEICQNFVEANRTKIPVTISGAGTGITGSRVPIHGGIVLSMEKFLKTPEHPNIKKINHEGLAGEILFYFDEEKGVAHLPPGISLQELTRALPQSVFYPPDPTETSAFLGGTVATNASGARSFYFGATREWISGLRIVLANADVLSLTRGQTFADKSGRIEISSESGKKYSFKIPDYISPKLKNAAGLYSRPGMDALDLFIGSEGIFGVFTDIKVNLAQKQDNIISDLAFFGTEKNSFEYVNELRRMKKEGILAIEFFDDNSLEFIKNEYPSIKANLKAAVFIEIFGSNYDLLARLSRLQEKCCVKEDWCAHTNSNARDLKEFRHALPDGVNSYLKQHQSYKLGTDFVVPVDNFPSMMERYKAAGQSFKKKFKRRGAHYVIFGHIGDCHVHFNFITQSLEEQKMAKKLYGELAQTAISLGGTISGEHGIGKKTIEVGGKQIPYLEMMYGKSALVEIAKIKNVFDPNHILNIDNIVPLEYLKLAN